MRRLLILTFIFASAAAVSTLHAQSLDAFKRHLAAPASGSAARVEINESEDAARAVAQAARNNTRMRFHGYRVCIFFDNGQNARAGAESALALFASSFPGVKAYKVYESPYFKVSVGNCLTAEEAIILKGKVSGVFTKAFLKNEELSAADLLN